MTSDRWASFWFLNGGGIHCAWKQRSWSALRGFAESLPRLAWTEQQKEIDRLTSELERYRAVAEAVAPLVAEWRAMPKFADDVWQKRQNVVLAFEALRPAEKGTM